MVLQEDAQKKVEMTQNLVKIYEWLLNMYMLDFYVDHQWSTLPASWTESLQTMDPEDLGTLLSGAPIKHMLPLSLLSLVKCAHTLSISRKTNYKTKIIEDLPHSEIANNPKLKNLFLKHVKLKKRHEINLMAEIVNETAKLSNCGAILDFGSGLGHLMRVLSYKYDLFTMGIESQSQLTEQARAFDSEVEYTARKHLSEELMSKLKRPTHLNLTLTSPEQLLQLPLTANITEYGLIGLHPCGDLGPLLLKHFVSCKKVKFICIVGCCYMKLSCDTEPYGYPMSEYVKNLGSKLTFTSREIACHAIETYAERLLKGEYEYLKIHAFRAALEKILVDHDPALKHAPVRSIKHSNTMTFDSYCSAALSRLHVCLCAEAVSAGRDCVSRWRHVVLLYSLRLLLAPAVETLVLLDRMLYILEHGLQCEIRPVFDPKISPRNHIIIGRRI